MCLFRSITALDICMGEVHMPQWIIKVSIQMIWFIINANHFTLISQGYCLPCYNREQKILVFTFYKECSRLKILNLYLSNCCQGQEGILPLLCIPAYLLVQKCQFQYQLPAAYLHRLRHHLEKSETYISLRLRRRLNRWYVQAREIFVQHISHSAIYGLCQRPALCN